MNQIRLDLFYCKFNRVYPLILFIKPLYRQDLYLARYIADRVLMTAVTVRYDRIIIEEAKCRISNSKRPGCIIVAFEVVWLTVAIVFLVHFGIKLYLRRFDFRDIIQRFEVLEVLPGFPVVFTYRAGKPMAD